MSLPKSNNRSGFRKMILLLIIASAAALLMSPVSAATGITITASGDQSYYYGEKVVLSGMNYDSDSTYLFITGPGISDAGGKLSSPFQNVISGNPDSFEVAKIKPDKSWEYTFYTGKLGLDPGPYTIHAVSQPKPKNQLNGVSFNSVSIILKKPFLTADITPSSISKGEPFKVTGYAEGEPGPVQLWIIGDNFFFTTTTPVTPVSAFYEFRLDPQIAGRIPKGQNYLIVQHPMQNDKLDIDASGDFVRNQQIDTDLFRSKGAGSLQGHDAEQALIAAFNDPNIDDTYTEIPIVVKDAGASAPVAQSPDAATTSVQQQTQLAPTQTQHSPLMFAPIGAILLIFGIVIWMRR